MKLFRVLYENRVRWGCRQEDDIFFLNGSPLEGLFKLSDQRAEWSSCSILAPSEPSKIVAAGLNYTDHAAELDMKVPEEPVIFLKPSSSILDPEKPVILPWQSERVDYEAEIACVISKQCRNIKPVQAKSFIFGYCCFNDITARDLQSRDGQWTRAKSFDTFSPFGPCLVTPDDLDPSDLSIQALVNGKIRQDSRTSNLIFPFPELISFISGVMTLFPGDVITTGTPPGIGPLKSGDRVEVRIEGIGTLSNPVLGET